METKNLNVNSVVKTLLLQPIVNFTILKNLYQYGINT